MPPDHARRIDGRGFSFGELIEFGFAGGDGLHTILLVDDESELREVVVAILEEPGHAVLTASDGYEALRVLVERPVDLLITDLKMPGISGFELARQAKLMRPRLHVIYISGSQGAAVRTEGRTYGRVLRKPVRANDLLVEVTQALGLPPARSAQRSSGD